MDKLYFGNSKKEERGSADKRGINVSPSPPFKSSKMKV